MGIRVKKRKIKERGNIFESEEKKLFLGIVVTGYHALTDNIEPHGIQACLHHSITNDITIFEVIIINFDIELLKARSRHLAAILKEEFQ